MSVESGTSKENQTYMSVLPPMPLPPTPKAPLDDLKKSVVEYKGALYAKV
jgi:hypothetical protein